MNDCVYYFIQVCDGEHCAKCTKYFSANARGADVIYEAYQADIEEALIPVHEKWKEMFEKGKIG